MEYTMDREYVKAIVRMVTMGLGECAMMHIINNFIGVPVVDFVEVFCSVADSEFMLDESFIPFFYGTKTVDDLQWRILYQSDAKRNGGWQ